MICNWAQCKWEKLFVFFVMSVMQWIVVFVVVFDSFLRIWILFFICKYLIYKVKQSRYRPGVAQRVPGS